MGPGSLPLVEEAPEGVSNGPITSPLITILIGLMLSVSRSVWVHKKGDVGEETTGPDEESVTGVLRPTEGLFSVSIEEEVDTVGQTKKTSKTPTTHDTGPSVPDTSKTPVNSWGGDIVEVQVRPDEPRVRPENGPTRSLKSSGVMGVEVGLNDTKVIVVSKEDALGW